MRNVARLLVWDIGAPLVAIGALVMIGLMLGWPMWWVSACSILCLLIVQAVIVNIVLYRRDSVTLGTDDEAPGLRSVVIGLCAALLAVTVAVGYGRWSVTDREFARDSEEVVRIASAAAVATATFTPGDPQGSIDRALALMAPDQADKFRSQFEKATADLAKRNVTAGAQVISAGLEVLSPSDASVAVILRGTQNAPGQPPSTAVLALRVAMSGEDGHWLVSDVSPINGR